MSSDVASGGPISVGRRSHYPLLAVGAVLLGSYIASFHSRLLSQSLPDLRGSFGLSFDEGAWLNTAALAPQILIAPAVAWLATVFGVRRVLIGPSLAYAAISLAIPFVRDYQLLLGLHFVHGLLLGTFVPATIMIIFRNLPMRWWLPGISVYIFRQALSLNWGVALVDYYVQYPGWQWVYWQDVVAAPLMGLLTFFGAPREPVNRTLLANADWGGMLLLGAGFALIYAGMDQGNRLDWFESGVVTSLLAAGGTLVVGFFVNEALVREPWASADVILARNVGVPLLVAVLYTFTSLSSSMLVPGFLSTVGHLRPEQIGHMLTFYGALPLFVFMPLTVYALTRVDARLTMMAGLACFAVASLLGTRLTHDWGPDDFIPMTLVQSAGQCLAFLSVVIFAMGNANPARATAITAYIQVIRLNGAELATTLMATWLRVQEQVHSNLLGLHVAAGDSAVVQTLTTLSARFSSHGASPGTASARGASTLASLVQQEAYVLSYVDAFWITFWFAIAALFLVALLKQSPPGPFTPARRTPAADQPTGGDRALQR
ncbi:MAG TPA: MFS transporter [Ancylobacter sp.]